MLQVGHVLEEVRMNLCVVAQQCVEGCGGGRRQEIVVRQSIGNRVACDKEEPNLDRIRGVIKDGDVVQGFEKSTHDSRWRALFRQNRLR